MTIKKENTIAAIIDFQQKLMPHIHRNQELLTKVLNMINGLKILDVPMIITQQYTKGLGDTVDSINQILGDYTHIEKTSFSCCGEESFLEKIRQPGKTHVIILGIESHICVLQTALELLENNLTPVIVSDAVGSRNPKDIKVAIERMRDSGCIITTTESILFELCRKAGTPEFKEISRLLK